MRVAVQELSNPEQLLSTVEYKRLEVAIESDLAYNRDVKLESF